MYKILNYQFNFKLRLSNDLKDYLDLFFDGFLNYSPIDFEKISSDVTYL